MRRSLDCEQIRGLLFALGKVYERCGQSALAAATFRSAFLIDLVSVQERFEQGDFLLQHGWLDQAEAEFQAIFDLATKGTKPAVSAGLTFFNTGVGLVTVKPVSGLESIDTTKGTELCWG